MEDNKFKDTKGRWRTQSLFLEMTYDQAALYTMKEVDHADSGLPSFRRLYIEIGDPTEYRQANELVGGWEHWQALCSSKWFKDFIEPIRQELEVKLRSEALLQSYMLMFSDKSSALQAAKMFAEGKYKPSKGRGRPSNEEVEQELKTRADMQQRLAKDMDRLGLRVIQNEDED